MKRDQETFGLIEQERQRQQKGIELVVSENFVSDEVMRAMGSCMTSKYAEGYPGRRYYGGCEVVDESESLAVERAKKLSDAEYTNVQPHSGAQANMAVPFTCLKLGDILMDLNLDHDSHLLHGSPVNSSDTLYNPIGYNLDKETDTVDYDEMGQPACQHRPRLIIAGGSAHCREWDYAHSHKVTDEIGTIFMVGMTYPVGLIAAGLLESPIKYAYTVALTTHKTLRDLRGDIILVGKDFENPWGLRTSKSAIKMMSQLLNLVVFPGIQGDPLEHVIAAKAVTFGEAPDPSFKEYQKRVMKGAKAFGKAFVEMGYNCISGGADNHCLLIDLHSKYPDLTGKAAGNAFVHVDITVNKNMVPFDSRSAFQTLGIRMGTPAITTRGVKEGKMSYIVELIDHVLRDPEDEAEITKVCKEVNEMMSPPPILA